VKARILVVEDDLKLAQLLVSELSQAGYQVVAVHTGTDALVRADSERFDLLILDLNLPDIDGFEVAERLTRAAPANILMLTARSDVKSRVEGLYAGASDYLTKPFSVPELLARVHVRLRSRQAGMQVLQHGALKLDPQSGACYANGELLPLTAQEFKVLRLLLAQRGRIFSKEGLEERLYEGDLPGSNTIEVFISNLRKKLAAVGIEGLISTVRGLGYVVR
jgi:DNA-binding response OmpR family regulator